MSQVELKVLHGIIISTQTPDTTVKTFPRAGGTAYAISKVTGLPVIQTHRNGLAVEKEKPLLAEVKDGSVVFISGHGREASDVITGAYLPAGKDAKVVNHSLQLEQYRDLICQNSSKLKAGDKITVVLWSCQAGAGGDDSMAAKLAQLFWQQGIKTRIIAATTNVGRYQPDPENPDELARKSLRFRVPKSNKIHVFDCDDGQVLESRVSAKTAVHFGVGGIQSFTMREIPQAHRRLYRLFPTTVAHLSINNTVADAWRLLRARQRADSANSTQFCVYNCQLLTAQMKFKLLFNDGYRNKSIELTVDPNGNVFDGDNKQLDLSGENLNDKLKARVNALRWQAWKEQLPQHHQNIDWQRQAQDISPQDIAEGDFILCEREFIEAEAMTFTVKYKLPDNSIKTQKYKLDKNNVLFYLKDGNWHNPDPRVAKYRINSQALVGVMGVLIRKQQDDFRQQQIEQQRLREQQESQRLIEIRKQCFAREMPGCQHIVTLNASGLANGVHLFKLKGTEPEEFMIVAKKQEQNITLNLIAKLRPDNRIQVKYRGQSYVTLKDSLDTLVRRLMRTEHYNRVMQQCADVATNGVTFTKSHSSEPETFNIRINRNNVKLTMPAQVREDGKIQVAFHGQYIRVEPSELADTLTQLEHKQALIQAVDNYLKKRAAKRHKVNGRTKLYLHSFFPCFQFSYTDKRDAVEALKNALICGDKIERKHIKAMRQGKLHTTIKEVLEQHPSSLILSDTVDTMSVGRFLQPLEETAAVAHLR